MKNEAPHSVRSKVSQLARDRRGATAIEYSVLISMIMIALVGISSMGGVANSQSSAFQKLADQMNK